MIFMLCRLCDKHPQSEGEMEGGDRGWRGRVARERDGKKETNLRREKVREERESLRGDMERDRLI